jgi:hypothetical protein
LVKTFSSQEEIHQHYVAACEREGYTLETQTSAWNGLACIKRDESTRKKFIEKVNCESDVCTIRLELSIY